VEIEDEEEYNLHKNKKRVKDTVDFLNRKINAYTEDLISYNDPDTASTQVGETRGNPYAMDEENIVLFHSKRKLEKFFNEYPLL
jgi:hypothetical protein